MTTKTIIPATELQEFNISVKLFDVRQLTLEERLKLFDPAKHGGEVMITETVGQ